MQSVLADPTENSSASNNHILTDEYLIFKVGTEEYGICFSRVLEIASVEGDPAESEACAKARRMVKLRDKLIPAVDLRPKFGLPATQWSQRTCVIVVQVRGNPAPMAVGIAVDGVIEERTLTKSEIKRHPDFGPDAPHASSVTTLNGKRTILLDLDDVMSW